MIPHSSVPIYDVINFSLMLIVDWLYVLTNVSVMCTLMTLPDTHISYGKFPL